MTKKIKDGPLMRLFLWQKSKIWTLDASLLNVHGWLESIPPTRRRTTLSSPWSVGCAADKKGGVLAHPVQSGGTLYDCVRQVCQGYGIICIPRIEAEIYFMIGRLRRTVRYRYLIEAWNQFIFKIAPFLLCYACGTQLGIIVTLWTFWAI